MSARPTDLPHRPHLDRNLTMDPSASRRASLDRQTELARLKLVSKYYGHSNYSRPRPEGTPTPNPYRRPGHSYHDQYHDQYHQHSSEADVFMEPLSPTRRPRHVARYQDRGSIGSLSSAPSLIDDHTDSELSHDDDYEYHATTSQLFDSFWVAGDQDDSPFTDHPEKRSHAWGSAQKQKGGGGGGGGEQGVVRYPALIPSPHIKRTKKTSQINYDDYPVPPKPLEYTIPAQPAYAPPPPPPPPPPPKDIPEWPLKKDLVKPNNSEKPKTIRAVKSSYSLFPRQTTATTTTTTTTSTAVPPATQPKPSSRQRCSSRVSPPSSPLKRSLAQRKSSRPTHSHQNSDTTLPRILSPIIRAEETPRPHTSQGMPRSMYPSDTLPGSRSVHLCDPAAVSTTIPLFPSTNLADLINPRTAPIPPCSSAAGEPLTPTLAPQMSFFDFDSDSESEEGGALSRLVKGRRHRYSRSSSATYSPSKATKSTERARRRSRAPTASATMTRKPSHFDEPIAEEEPEEKKPAKEGRKSDVFGRMFGRGHR